MARFGYIAVEKFKYLTKKNLYEALGKQLNQQFTKSGVSERLGKICVENNFMTQKQVDKVLEDMLMEPNISWGENTSFAKMLNIEKDAKQAIGEKVGQRISGRPPGETIFLANSSTIYYTFLGMVKYGAHVDVLTIHAAILAAYPSTTNRIKSVRPIWKGRVDLENALIEPDNLDDPNTKAELNFLHGEATHAIISATGFDRTYGPMADNATAREVSRQALQSETKTCILIDHSKIRINTPENDPSLLFSTAEWNKIRDRGKVEVIVNCHPEMPKQQAVFEPRLRQTHKIKDAMLQQKINKAFIDDVLHYQEWSSRLGDILTEIPFA